MDAVAAEGKKGVRAEGSRARRQDCHERGGPRPCEGRRVLPMGHRKTSRARWLRFVGKINLVVEMLSWEKL